LTPDTVPHHVAMMIDGNRRWARQAGFTTVAHGHRAGAAKMHEFLRWCDDLGIRVVSLYLLSNDNLTKRDSQELADLIEIIAELADELSLEPGWRVQHVGRAEMLPPDLARVLRTAEERTAGNTGCTSTSRSATAGAARSSMPCAASSRSTTSAAVHSRSSRPASLRSRSASICTPEGRPIPIW
jgi:undecaprenyl diphosphate synthase